MRKNRIALSALAFACALTFFMGASLRATEQTNALEATPAQLKKLSLEDLMNLEVTSVSRRAEPYSLAPAAIQIITQEDIRRSGVSSLPEALRLANNLQVAQVDARGYGITARGFNGTTANKMLVMIDGRTVYTPLFSGVFWDAQDYLLEDIDRIEVISGPGATLYGANAVNGIISIVTKDARNTQGTLLTAGGGTELRAFAGLRYGGMISSNVFYRIYGNYFNRDSTAFANGADGLDDWWKAQGGFRLDWEASANDLITFQGDLYHGNETQIAGDDGKINGGNVLSRWTHTISEDSDFSLQLYHDRTYRDFPGTYGDNLDTYDLDFQHHFRIGERNNFIWGAGYRYTHNFVEKSALLAFLPAKLDRHLFSAFLQDEIKLRDNLTLTLGTKVEHNDYTGFEVQPSGRIGWSPATNHTIWAAISRAVRTPSRVDKHLYLPAAAPHVVINGGPDFVSETVIAYELGYRVQPVQKVSVSIATFFNQYDDVRGVTPAPFAQVDNLSEGETYGVELDVSYQILEWWRLRAGYTFLQEHIRVQPGKIEVNGGQGEIPDPQNQVFLSSYMSLPGNLELDGRLRFIDRLAVYSAGKAGTVPSYVSLDLRLGWNPTKNLEFSIVGQNLLDSQHPEFGFPTATRHEIERSVFGKVTWRF
ncbi:MAG: TonB-dependent receptor [Verrucomicrobiota bacterium]